MIQEKMFNRFDCDEIMKKKKNCKMYIYAILMVE